MLLCLLGQTAESRPSTLFLLAGQSEEKTGMYMWQKQCPVCRQPMQKKHPTETVPCTCGKYVWKG